jgi:hypothetical protein
LTKRLSVDENDELLTNRDLYLFVTELRRNSAGEEPKLEEYLRALWHLGSTHRTSGDFSLSWFAHLLKFALSGEAPPFDPAWRARAEEQIENPSGCQQWEQTVLTQIIDLHEMEAAGTLASEYRYFGVDAPRGNRWYNFDAMTYLECAAAGTFGGWQPDDATGRAYTPGANTEVEEPIIEISSVTWRQFANFLCNGQEYE